MARIRRAFSYLSAILARGRRKEKVRQHEQRRGRVHQEVGRAERGARERKGDQDLQRVLVDVVVERREELREKNGRNRRERSSRNCETSVISSG